MNPRRFLVTSLITTAALVLAGCGNSTNADADGPTTGDDTSATAEQSPETTTEATEVTADTQAEEPIPDISDQAEIERQWSAHATQCTGNARHYVYGINDNLVGIFLRLENAMVDGTYVATFQGTNGVIDLWYEPDVTEAMTDATMLTGDGDDMPDIETVRGNIMGDDQLGVGLVETQNEKFGRLEGIEFRRDSDIIGRCTVS